MKDVRCFKGEQSINIRPITLLVGENSAGKSTVLGCYHALLNLFSGHALDFNVAPFEMGAFADIMRNDENADAEFMIGVKDEFDGGSINYEFTFGQNEGESVLCKATIKFSSGGSITYANAKNKSELSVLFSINKLSDNFFIKYGSIESSNKIDHFLLKVAPYFLHSPQGINDTTESFKNFVKNKVALIPSKQEMQSFHDELKKLMPSAENFVGISPIRSKPRRTYHPFSGQAPSEGDNVPLFMRKIMRTNKEAWKYMHQELVNFGKKSGMFQDIKIRTFNDDMRDPFQIQVKQAGKYINIMDVGYGISQILPILVRMITTKHDMENKHSPISKPPNPDISTRFMLQQPEMHLHPQAQAAFGSLLVHFAENGKGQNFLVETHSDFIVDRICTEIRDKKISPENVSLVYHEMKKGYVQLHNITFDKMGNLENVPDGYRDFFMHEMNKVLGL